MLRVNLTEADSDYINVGNIMLPKDAREYGWDSYDSIRQKTQKKYDDEKEAERQAREREEAERRRQEFIAEHQDEIGKAEEILNGTGDPANILEELDSEMAEGQSAGWYIASAYCQMIAVGDYFFTGDETISETAPYVGLLTSSEYTEGAFATVIEAFLDKVDNENYPTWNLNRDYAEFLSNLAHDIVDFLLEHLELFATPFEEDYSDFADEEEYLRDKSHCYTYEVSSYNIDLGTAWEELEDAGFVEYDDLFDFVKNLDLTGWDTDFNEYASDVLEVTNLNLEELKIWEDEFYSEYEAWIEDLYNEHRGELGDIDFYVGEKHYRFSIKELKEGVEEDPRWGVNWSSLPPLDAEITNVSIETSYDSEYLDEDDVPTFRALCDHFDIDYSDYEDSLTEDDEDEDDYEDEEDEEEE